MVQYTRVYEDREILARSLAGWLSVDVQEVAARFAGLPHVYRILPERISVKLKCDRYCMVW